MSETLYLNCENGISGDMMVGLLLDLGADEQKLIHTLESLPIESYPVCIQSVMKKNIPACDYSLKKPNEEHLHRHRTLAEVKEIIEQAHLESQITELANKIYDIIAEAEAKAHETTIQKVHFHEVGENDSIMDIVAIAYCFCNLQISKVIVPYVSEGKGSIMCQHGEMEVPVPAVSNIFSKYQIPMRRIEENGEFVTPTGAAVLAATVTSYELPVTYQSIRRGAGAGKREYNRPAVLQGELIR